MVLNKLLLQIVGRRLEADTSTYICYERCTFEMLFEIGTSVQIISRIINLIHRAKMRISILSLITTRVWLT